jgi:hypothetical protein
MAFGTGVFKTLAIKKETSYGVAPSTGSAQYLRRVTSSLDVVRETYESPEIASDFQITDFRHGAQRIEGTLNGVISPGTYSLLLAAAMRKDFAAGATTGAQTNVTAAAGPPGTFTRAAGDFLADGFRIGDVIRWSGWTSGGTANNARNYRITALSATVMTVGTTLTGAVGQPEAVAAKASGDSVTATVVGKRSFTPSTGHTNDSFAIEHYHADLTLSELFLGCRVNTCELGLPSTGPATCSFGMLGRSMTPAGAQYFVTPTAAPSTGMAVAVSGLVRVNGADIAYLTGITLNYAGGMSTLPVVGSNLTPDVFAGRVRVSGQATAAFPDATLRDLFLNETEADLWIYLTTGSAVNADFISMYLARVKMGGAAKSDGESPIIQTLPFQSLGKKGSTTVENTTLVIQDSTL